MSYLEQGPYQLSTRFVGGLALPSSGSAGSVHGEEMGTEFVPMNLRHRLAVLGVLAFLSLAVVAAFLVLPRDKSPWLLPAFLLYTTLLTVPLVFFRHSFGWFHPVIFTVLLATYGLCRKSQVYLIGLSSHYALPGLDPARLNELAAYELILMSLGIFAYYIGFSVFRGANRPPLKLPAPRDLSLKCALAVLFSLATLTVYIYGKGGVTAHIQDFSHRSVTMDGEGFWQPLTAIGSIACLVWLASEPSAIRSIPFLLCAALSLSVNYFTMGSRSSVIYTMAIGAIVIMLRCRKVFLTQLVALGVVSLILVGVLGNFRRSTWTGAADWSTLFNVNPFQAASGDAASEIAERSSSFSPTMAILDRVPREVPFLFGSSYTAVLAWPIPKVLWPDKPQGIHSLTGEAFFNLVAGTPPGMVGEAYWNFYIPGVFLAYFLFGLFHRWLAQCYLNNRKHPLLVLAYILTLFNLQGDSGSIPFWLNSILPLLLLMPIAALPIGGRRARLPQHQAEA